MFVASMMVMPDFLLALLFEEIVTLLPLLSILLTPTQFFGDPDGHGEHLGLVVVFASSMVLLAVLMVLAWLVYATVNGIEKVSHF